MLDNLGNPAGCVNWKLEGSTVENLEGVENVFHNELCIMQQIHIFEETLTSILSDSQQRSALVKESFYDLMHRRSPHGQNAYE